MKRPVVALVQRVLPHYRIPFFSGLHRRLAESGISLRLIYGQEYPDTVPRTVECPEEWCRRISNRYMRFAGTELVWQPCLAEIEDADLVVVEQANRLAANVPILLGRRKRRRRVAYFGHGRNGNRAAGLPGKLSTRLFLPRVDWWFAYTGLSAVQVEATGFPPDRITTVNNTIDTESFRESLASVSEGDMAAIADGLCIRGENIVLFCGGLDGAKRLDFLLQACLELRRRIPDFHAIIIGDGPSGRPARTAAASHPWIHFTGALFGAARAPYFRMAGALLMPGPVGLAIVDSFAATTPVITTDIPWHGPEIAYLEPGVNGIMTSDSLSGYVDAVAGFLKSEELRNRLAHGCRESARRYTMSAMVERFATGVEQCLAR
jgi:glycosyltransferase involved in cell wall biosynthesis